MLARDNENFRAPGENRTRDLPNTRSNVLTTEPPGPGCSIRKPVNANPGLKVNRGNNFSGIKVSSIAYVLCSLRLLAFKTEGQKI